MQKSIKIIIKSFCLLLILIFIGFALLPTWLSSSHGTKTTLKWINANLSGSLSIEKIELNWFGPQRLENIQWKDPEGTILGSCLTFETNTSLLYVLFGGRTFGRTFIEAPYLVLTKQILEKKDKHPSNKKPNKKHFELPKFDDNLIILNGTFIVPTDNPSFPITISDIHFDKSATPNHLLLNAVTVQGNVNGTIHVDLDTQEHPHFHIQIKNFPVAIVDSLACIHLVSETLGPFLNIEARLEKNAQNVLSLNGSARSANLAAHMEGILEKNQVTIFPNSALNLTLTPSLFKQLISEKQKGNWELASKTQLEIQIEKAILPLTLKPNFKELILQAQARLQRAELHHISLGSYTLSHFNLSAISNTQLEIQYQGEIQGKEATKISGNVSRTGKGDMLFHYECKGFPVTLLKLIAPELESKIRLLLGSNFDLKGQGSYASKALDTKLMLDAPDVQLTAHCAGRIPELNFDISGTRHLHGDKAQVLGSSLNLTLNGITKIQGTSLVIPFLKGRVFNPYIDLEVSGQIGEEGKPLSLDQIQLLAVGSIKKLPLEEKLSASALQNCLLFMQIDGAKNLITGKAESKALEARFSIEHFIQKNDEVSFSQSTTHFTCNLQDFPVAVASPFLSEDVNLTTFLGKTLSLNAKGSYTPHQEPRFCLDLNGQGEGWTSSLSFTLDQALKVKQNKPSFIYWEMTPERYAALVHQFRIDNQAQPSFVLTRTAPIELNIHQFTCPTISEATVGRFLCQSGFVGDLSIGTTEFRSLQTNESITFQGVSGSIKGENFSKAIDIALEGKILAPNIPKSMESTFSFAGQMLNFWTTKGKFNREGLTVKGELNLDLLPVRQVTGMFPLDHETRSIVQAVLGELVNARISGQISQLTGPITIDIKSSNFKALIPLEMKKIALYLRDYVDAEITLTPAVDATLLKDINPLIIAGAYSDHPIKVYIDPKGFVLPIRPYSLAQVEIPNAIVDLGKIMVRNGGQIHSLLQFLNAKEITPEGLMEAWFTPIFLNLHHGVATYKRFDALLAGNVHIALWGSINLINEKVDMTLAVAPTTLYERFKIAGLTNKDMFQVKMKGTTSKLDLDWSSAYSRIAWIVARSSAGFLSDIIGGILEQLVSHLGEEPVPPPTTDPLPWEKHS